MDPETEPQVEAPAKIVLTLEFDPATQEMKVNGPLANRMLCYGLLKMAEKAIDESYKPRIQLPGVNGKMTGGFFRRGG